MKHIYLTYHGQKEQKELIELLIRKGYSNIQDISWENYQFPVLIVNKGEKNFFGSNATCMSALSSSGIKAVYYKEIDSKLNL